MEANGVIPDVMMPSLLADVEVSHLAGFDVTPSPHAEPSPRPQLRHDNPSRSRVRRRRARYLRFAPLIHG